MEPVSCAGEGPKLSALCFQSLDSDVGCSTRLVACDDGPFVCRGSRLCVCGALWVNCCTCFVSTEQPELLGNTCPTQTQRTATEQVGDSFKSSSSHPTLNTGTTGWHGRVCTVANVSGVKVL